MSPALPYIGAGFLLLLVLALWARQLFLARRGRAELIVKKKHPGPTGSPPSYSDLGERIFALEDWFFVSVGISSEIRQMFLRERTVLATSWLRRTRKSVSLVMHAHVAAVQQIDGIQLSLELKLVLDYVVFLVLCNLLIGWIWLCGPVHARKTVGQVVRTAMRLRASFERLVSGPNGRALQTNYNHGGGVKAS